MSIRDRIKIASENAAYFADTTWSKDEPCSLQKSHMELFLREKLLQEQLNLEQRPRTVKDCIPNSRLAKYTNCEYNHSRELSYSCQEFQSSTIFTPNLSEDGRQEIWMSDEVEILFQYYMSSEESKEVLNDRVRARMLESPFLKTNSLYEHILKLELGKDNVRKLWDSSYRYCNNDFFDVTNVEHELLQQKGEEDSTVQDRRLYSAVLQGFSSKMPRVSNENQMTVLRRFVNVSRSADPGLLDKYQNTNSPLVKTNPRITLATEPRLFAANQYAQQMGSYNCTRFVPSLPVQRLRPGFFQGSYLYPSFYMFIQNSFQQQQMVQSFYNPTSIQRRTVSVPSIRQSSLPRQSQLSSKNCRRWDDPVPKKKKQDSVSLKRDLRTLDALSSCSSDLTKTSSESSEVEADLDDLVKRTAYFVLEEKLLPVSGTSSDELERQALEQYTSSSTDNVFQELERQAVEEYQLSYSENCQHPPNFDGVFGGFFIRELCAF